MEGTEILISGKNFQEGLRVKIGGVLAKVHFISSQEIAVKSPRLPPGLQDILLINPDDSFCKKEPIILYIAKEDDPMVEKKPPPIVKKNLAPSVISLDPVICPMEGFIFLFFDF